MKIANRLDNIKKSLIRTIYESASPDSINFGLGEVQFETPLPVINRAKQILDQKIFPYTENAGLLALRSEIAMYYHNAYKNNQICITNGAEEAIFCVLFSLIDPGNEVVIPNPCYLAYSTITTMLGGNIIPFTLDTDMKFDKNAFSVSLTNRTKLVFLSHPSNPLSSAFTLDEMKVIVDTCKQRNILLVVDEVYRDIYLDEPVHSFAELTNVAVIISSVSKSHCMTGWRLGWVACPDWLISSVVVSHQYISTCASRISQEAAIACFSDEGIESVSLLRHKLLTNYEYCIQLLVEHNIPYIKPQAGPYLFIKVNSDDLNLAVDLCKHGIITVPGRAFGTAGMGYLRINYALDIQLLKKGFPILLNHIAH